MILEFSHVAKLPTDLEKEGERMAIDTSSLMSHFIGQTVRYLHYCFQSIISTEKNSIVLNQSLKTSMMILLVTPYEHMCKGIAKDLVSRIVKSIEIRSAEESSEETEVMLSAISAVGIALSQSNIADELIQIAELEQWIYKMLDAESSPLWIRQSFDAIHLVV